MLEFRIAGQHDIRTNTSYEQRIPIADILIHPKYDHSTYDYDHALVKLSRKATITDRVKTICLPDHNTSFPVGTKCFVTGWGLLSHAGRGPKVRLPLHKVSLDSTELQYSQKYRKHCETKRTHRSMCSFRYISDISGHDKVSPL